MDLIQSADVQHAAREKLIVALDYATLDEALDLVDKLGGQIELYKVGLEIFLRTRGAVIDVLHKKGKKVFLDLKFHDITNTVVQACRFACEQHVFMFNVHCANAEKTLKAAAEVLKAYDSHSLCIGVSVLTNLCAEDLRQLYGAGTELFSTVDAMAHAAFSAGLNGIVCSAREASAVKKRFGKDFITVCPGVRPAFMHQTEFSAGRAEDQERIMNACEAVQNGADYLVVGRPITQHADPEKAAGMTLAEIAVGLQER